MGLRFDPVGGGQFKRVVDQLIQAEREPIRQLEARKAEQNEKLKTFQAFKTKFTGLATALDSMSSLEQFRELKADLGDAKDLLDITIDKSKAQPGSYQIQIDELANRSSLISNSFSSADEATLGAGYLVSYKPDGERYEVFIDSDRSSLHGVAEEINKQKDSPISAEVVYDAYTPDEPWRLIVKSKAEGEQNNIDLPEFYFLDGGIDFYVDDSKDAQNAYLKVDGFEIDAPGNEVKDFFTGVNFKIKQARPDKPFMLNISVDYEKVSQKFKGTVDSINEVLKFIKAQNSVDESSNTRVMFTGDTGIQTVEYRLRNLMHEAFPVYFNNGEDYRLVHLNQAGIEFNREGLLKIDEKKFQKALEDDFSGLSEAITGENGFVAQLKAVITPYTRGGDGFLAMREKGLRSRIESIDKNIENKERLIDMKSKSLRDKFSRLQGTIGSMQSQQASLAALGGGGGGGSMVENLLASGG